MLSSQIRHPGRLNLEVYESSSSKNHLDNHKGDEEPDDDDENDESKKLKTCNKNERNYDSDVSQRYRYTHTAQLVTIHMSFAQ